MNRPAGAVTVWWTNPPDIDAEYPFLAYSLGHGVAAPECFVTEPLRARIARVLRTDIGDLRASVRRGEPELVA